MNNASSRAWLAQLSATVETYRRMIDGTIEQLTDVEFFARPTSDANSVAVLLRHLGGNLQSRWTDFLTTDGEKATRNRDAEFEDWNGPRQSLMDYFNQGWLALTSAIESMDEQTVNSIIEIRGEPHTVPQALIRSITHMTYHVGQITMTAKLVHQGPWNWLTIEPGKSIEHNKRTWGSSASSNVSLDNDGDQ